MPPKRKSRPGGKGLRSQLKGLEKDLNVSTVGKMLTRRTKQKGGKFSTSFYSFPFFCGQKDFYILPAETVFQIYHRKIFDKDKE